MQKERHMVCVTDWGPHSVLEAKEINVAQCHTLTTCLWISLKSNMFRWHNNLHWQKTPHQPQHFSDSFCAQGEAHLKELHVTRVCMREKKSLTSPTSLPGNKTQHVCKGIKKRATHFLGSTPFLENQARSCYKNTPQLYHPSVCSKSCPLMGRVFLLRVTLETAVPDPRYCYAIRQFCQ